MDSKTLTVALTGGIASGKSTIAMIFSKLGVPTFDTDEISKGLLAKSSETLSEVVRLFGHQILNPDGSLDRRKLRSIVFNCSNNKKKLEEILHPKILSETIHKIKLVEQPYCIVEIPLLAEIGVPNWVDVVVVADASEDVRIKRVMARDQVTNAEAKSIVAAQTSRNARLAIADFVINTQTSFVELKSQVDHLHKKLLDMSESRDS